MVMTPEEVKASKKAAFKRWRDKRLEEDRERCRKYHHANKDSALGKFRAEKALLRSAKHRAKRTGKDFDITLEDIVIPNLCPVLGTPIIRKEIVDGSKSGLPDSPSLDRVDNNKGYVKGNVRVISLRANILKGSNDRETLKLLLDYLNAELPT